MTASRILGVIVVALGVLVASTVIGGRVFYRPFNIPSAAMEPTLLVGDLMLMSQFAYQSAPPALGDVIVFYGPRDAYYIKRVVGLPGDHVQMINGVLFINKKPVPKRRVADFVQTDEFGITLRVPQFREMLPNAKTYLVLDRGDSEEDNTPDFLVPAASYFVIGDNRDNSDDSRISVGFVPRNKIVGRAAIIYFSARRPTWRDVE